MSNLLKKASIITTPTAYDDGRILSVKPNENIYGSELVTNGDFSNGTTGWSSPDYNSTLSIVNGQMKIVSTISLGRVLQAITTEVGKKYLISATTTNIDSSTGIQIKVSNAANLDGATYSSEFNTTTNPLTITHRFIATATTTYIGSSQGSSVGQSALLDNISVVEDLSGDFDFERGSAATRVNAQGLVENVQILSSELVQNGNFSQEGSEEVVNGDFATDSDWSGTLTIANGQLTKGSGGGLVYQSTLDGTIKSYKVIVDVAEKNGASLKLYLGGNQFTLDEGLQTLYVQSGNSNNFIGFNNGADSVINSISCVEVGQDWALGSGWSVGSNLINATSTSSVCFQDIASIQSSKTYKVVYQISNYSGGNIQWRFGGTATVDGATRNANGIYTEYFTNTSGGDKRFFLSPSSFSGSITNISVKEVTDDTDLPRINYEDGCGSWLFEPQSTNLYPYSEDFTQWDKVGTTVIENAIISPNGSLNSDKIEETTGGTYHNVNEDFGTLSSGSTYTASAFYKSAERTSATIYESLSTGGYNLTSFNLTNGTVISEDAAHTATIKDYGNGWYKCSITFTLNASRSGSIFYGTNDILNFIGVSGNGVYIWGAQVEQLSYATSYIPTNGAASTRLQDIANNSGNSDLINSTEGVLYVDIAALTDLGSYRLISLNSDNSSSNRITIAYDVVNNQIYGQCVDGGVSQALFTTQPTSISDFNKIALKYKANDLAFWVNGFEVGTNTSASIPTNLNRLSFDRADAAAFFYGKTKALAVWKEALTDTELELLTAPAPEFPTFSLDFDTIAEQFTFTRGSEATFVNEQGLIQSTNELGAELVNSWTNQDFSSFASNGSNITQMVSSGSGNNCYSPTTITSGKTYKMEFTCSQNITAQIRISNNNNLTSAQVVLSNPISGLNSIIFTANANYTYVGVYAASAFSDTQISGFTLKEHITATNTPRIDYSTGVEAFLLEPQSTNLITYSEDFSNSYWTKIRATLTSGFLAPDGTTNAFKLTENTDNQTHLFYNPGFSISDATECTMSLFVKYNGRQWFRLFGQFGSSSKNAYFDIKNGLLGFKDSGTFSEIKDYGNGWYRISQTVTSDGTFGRFRGYLAEADNDAFYQGDGTSGVYIWGGQYEQKSYPTSYIPTDGATATRNQETCVDATPTINSEEGVLYAEISALANDGTFREISLNDGTTNNVVEIRYTTIDNAFEFIVRNANTVQVASSFTLTDATQFNKIAFSYKTDDYKMYVNGVEVASDTSGTVPSGLNKLSFNWGGFNPFFGNTKGLQVFDKALSDYQLKQLTTI